MKSRCAACKKRITKGEPDLVLCRMDPDNPMRASVRLVYHVRCESAALERAATTLALWHMVHRYIEAEAN